MSRLRITFGKYLLFPNEFWQIQTAYVIHGYQFGKCSIWISAEATGLSQAKNKTKPETNKQKTKPMIHTIYI